MESRPITVFFFEMQELESPHVSKQSLISIMTEACVLLKYTNTNSKT